MRTRKTIESELIYFAQRANASGDTSEYQEYINRMQLDLLMDIRDLLIDAAHPPITVYYPQSDAELDKVMKGFNAPRV